MCERYVVIAERLLREGDIDTATSHDTCPVTGHVLPQSCGNQWGGVGKGLQTPSVCVRAWTRRDTKRHQERRSLRGSVSQIQDLEYIKPSSVSRAQAFKCVTQTSPQVCHTYKPSSLSHRQTLDMRELTMTLLGYIIDQKALL